MIGNCRTTIINFGGTPVANLTYRDVTFPTNLNHLEAINAPMASGWYTAFSSAVNTLFYDQMHIARPNQDTPELYKLIGIEDTHGNRTGIFLLDLIRPPEEQLAGFKTEIVCGSFRKGTEYDSITKKLYKYISGQRTNIRNNKPPRRRRVNLFETRDPVDYGKKLYESIDKTLTDAMRVGMRNNSSYNLEISKRSLRKIRKGSKEHRQGAYLEKLTPWGVLIQPLKQEQYQVYRREGNVTVIKHQDPNLNEIGTLEDVNNNFFTGLMEGLQQYFGIEGRIPIRDLTVKSKLENNPHELYIHASGRSLFSVISGPAQPGNSLNHLQIKQRVKSLVEGAGGLNERIHNTFMGVLRDHPDGDNLILATPDILNNPNNNPLPDLLENAAEQILQALNQE